MNSSSYYDAKFASMNLTNQKGLGDTINLDSTFPHFFVGGDPSQKGVTSPNVAVNMLDTNISDDDLIPN
jgi:hypothetical protein